MSFFGFVLLSLVVYYPSYKYGIVTDFLSWLYRYDEGSFKDILHCFDYPGLHQFFHLINYTAFKIVGTSHFGWYFILALFHGINGCLLLELNKAIVKRYVARDFNPILLFLISFLFVLYPYNLEAVIWKACLHYLLITMMIFYLIKTLISYFESSSTKKSFTIHILFTLCLFTLELSFAIPIFTFAFLVFDHFSGKAQVSFKKKTVQILIPQILIFISYFILTKLSIGDYIGHYGAENHLVFTPEIVLGNSWRYFFKNLALVHFWPFEYKEWFYAKMLSKPLFFYGLSLLAVLGFIWTCIKWKTLSSLMRLSAFNLISFFIFLAPVINLFFMWLLGYENDRYGYLSSAFFISAFVFLCSAIRLSYLRYFLIALYSIVLVVFFTKMMTRAQNAGEIEHRLLSSFDFEDHDGELYILAAPDNFRGLYLFRDYTNDGLALREALDFFQNKDVKSEMIDVAQYNHHYLMDSIKVDFIDSTTLHVGFAQYNNWFWRNGIGLSDYETEDFKVERKPGFYRLTFKEPKPDQLFIYPQAGIWATFRWPYFVNE